MDAEFGTVSCPGERSQMEIARMSLEDMILFMPPEGIRFLKGVKGVQNANSCLGQGHGFISNSWSIGPKTGRWTSLPGHYGQKPAKKDKLSRAFHKMRQAALTAPARAAAGVALHARAVAHEGVVAAFAAGVALIALHLGFGAGVHADRSGRERGCAVERG